MFSIFFKIAFFSPDELCTNCDHLYIDKDTDSMHYNSSHCCKKNQVYDEWYYTEGDLYYLDCSVVRERQIVKKYCKWYKERKTKETKRKTNYE